MDCAARFHRDRTGLIDGVADHVHDAPERALADRNRDRAARVDDFLAANQTFGRVHRDAAHVVLAEVLGDFEHEAAAPVGRFERVENRRKVAVELHVDDGADHLDDAAGGIRDIRHNDVLVQSLKVAAGDGLDQSASAPEMISMSSLVIIAWRVRL